MELGSSLTMYLAEVIWAIKVFREAEQPKLAIPPILL
jgi:hypothetical protein